MRITIGKSCAVSEQGGRKNNEDAVYPLPEQAKAGQKLFLVCDGVGGAEKGEVASNLACESFESYFDTFLEGEPDETFVRKALQYTEARFDGYLELHPEAAGMATTLAMVYFGTKGVMVTHIGDSRVYQFRQGKILYRTEDHSLVNSLVRLGQLTPDEARSHPQRNVILRAIQGNSCPTEVEVTFLTDVMSGDFLFLCTDGVLEQLSDAELASLFSRQASVESLKDAIVEICQGKTHDNFSFYIIPIQNVHESIGIRQNILSFLYSLA